MVSNMEEEDLTKSFFDKKRFRDLYLFVPRDGVI